MASHVEHRVSDLREIYNLLEQTPINTEKLTHSIDSYSSHSKPVDYLPVYKTILITLTRQLLQNANTPEKWKEHCKLNNVVIEKMDDYNPRNTQLYQDVFERVAKQKLALINAEAYVVQLNLKLASIKQLHQTTLKTLESWREFNPTTDKEIQEENDRGKCEMQRMKAEYEKMLKGLEETLT